MISQPSFFLADSAFLAFVSGWALVMFALFVRHKLARSKLRAYFRGDFYHNRGEPVEIAIAICALFFGLLLRSGFVWEWRINGAALPDFPLWRVAIGDIFIGWAILCIIRTLAPEESRNWQWISALSGGVIFAAVSIFLT